MIHRYGFVDAKGEFTKVVVISPVEITTHRLGKPYKYSEVRPEISENEVYSGATVAIGADTIVKTFTKRTLTDAEYFAKKIPTGAVALWAFRAAAKLAGHFDAIENGINALAEPDKTVAKSQWEYATNIERKHPTTVALAAALGFTDAQLDAVFLAAKELEG